MHVAYPGDFAKGENEFTGVATQSDGSVVFTTGLAEKWLRPDKTLTDIRTDDKGDQVLGLLLATGRRTRSTSCSAARATSSCSAPTAR